MSSSKKGGKRVALRRSAEDYLEAMYVLKKEKGAVRSIDIAHHMNYSKPSVSRAVNNLKTSGHINMRPDGELVFTALGEKTAKNVYERHTLLVELFMAIGVSKEVAADDACNVEHALSEETFECLKVAHKKYVEGSLLQQNIFEKADDDKDDKKKKKKKKKN